MTTKMNGVSKEFQRRQLQKRAANADGHLATLRPPRLLPSYGWEAFGQLVVQWRVERGLSSHELADDAGMSIEVIRTIESGAGMPSARYLLTLGELMELSVEKLLQLVGLVIQSFLQPFDEAVQGCAQLNENILKGRGSHRYVIASRMQLCLNIIRTMGIGNATINSVAQMHEKGFGRPCWLKI